MNREELDDMITLAVLGELSDTELAALDEALAADPAARAELDAQLAAAATMQIAAAETPPPALKASVLDAIADIAGAQVRPTGADDPPATPRGPVASSGTAAPVVSLDGRRRRIGQLVLAAAAAIVFVVGGVMIAGDRGGGPSSFDAVATAPDAELRTLAGTLPGSLRVIHSAEQGAIVVDGADLPAVAGNETYQLWLVAPGGAVRSAGLFRPAADGRVMERFDGLDPTGFTIAVTLEPAGGSDQPTLPIIAST